MKMNHRKFSYLDFFFQHVGSEHENLAKLVFMELNNAFSDFENDATKQNII